MDYRILNPKAILDPTFYNPLATSLNIVQSIVYNPPATSFNTIQRIGYCYPVSTALSSLFVPLSQLGPPITRTHKWNRDDNNEKLCLPAVIGTKKALGVGDIVWLLI